jgi:hypothetical protein
MTSFSNAARSAAVLCVACVFLYVVPRAIGIDRFDETLYLRSAAFITPASFIAHSSWGPLYSLWYRALSLVCPDPFARYVFSWRLLVALLFTVPFFLQLPKARLYVICLIALPALITPPYVSLFAAAVLLPGACFFLAHPQRSLSDACAAAGAMSFVVAFARPEFGDGVFLAALGVIGALIFELRNRQTRAAAKKPVPFKLLLIAGLVAITAFVQARSAPERRSAVAFVQHFNLRAGQTHRLKPGEDPYRSDYAARAFGLTANDKLDQNAFPLGAYLSANPILFLRHVFSNFTDRRTLILLILFIPLTAYPWFHSRDRNLRASSLYLICIAVPPLAGIFVIYPRDHYAMIIVPSLVIYALQLSIVQQWLVPSPFRTTALVIALLATGCFTLYRLRGLTEDRSEVARIQCIRNIDKTLSNRNYSVIDTGMDLAVYIPHTVTWLDPMTLSRWDQFEMQASTVRPLWIADDQELAGRIGASSEQIDVFLRTALGYTPHPCPAAAEGLVIYTRQ